MRVRRPFEPELEEREKRDIRPNEEEEEKPVMPVTSMTSEETHGGEESTQSVQDSPNPAEQDEPQNSENSSNNSSNDYENSGEQESSEKDASEEGDCNDSSGDSCEEDTSSSDSEDENSEDSEDGNAGEESEGYEEDGSEQGNSHTYNTEEAVELSEPARPIKVAQTEFYRFVERIAEDKTRVFSGEAGEYLNVRRLMLRQYERKPLSYYWQDKVRDTIILILDDSGSMHWWAESLSVLAKIALTRGDVEIYVAPNGYIISAIKKGQRVGVDHEKFMKVQGRKIIYVGDFDGADTPIQLSWRNDVIWICPESRYRRFQSHNWVSYRESDFKGVFIRAYNLDEMFRALKQVTRFYRLWIDLHEGDEFEDDGGDEYD